jgi:hypothetical protein
MKALRGRCSLMKGFAPIIFSLICAALMILIAWWKRGAPAGSPLQTRLEWAIQLLVVLVIVGISVTGVPARHILRCGQPR